MQWFVLEAFKWFAHFKLVGCSVIIFSCFHWFLNSHGIFSTLLRSTKNPKVGSKMIKDKLVVARQLLFEIRISSSNQKFQLIQNFHLVWQTLLHFPLLVNWLEHLSFVLGSLCCVLTRKNLCPDYLTCCVTRIADRRWKLVQAAWRVFFGWWTDTRTWRGATCGRWPGSFEIHFSVEHFWFHTNYDSISCIKIKWHFSNELSLAKHHIVQTTVETMNNCENHLNNIKFRWCKCSNQ